MEKLHHFIIKNTFLLVTLLTMLGAFLHFYNINWGAPYYFHPDERNIASSVSQLAFPNKMNPNFFAYGSLPIYTIYFSGVAGHLLSHTSSAFTSPPMEISFAEAIVISRFYSALFATMLIPLIFMLGTTIKDKTTGLLAASFVTTSTGLIQFAHFGTFEMWLTFFSVLLFWFLLNVLKRNNLLDSVGIAVCLGILVATKITSLTLLPLLVIVYVANTLHAKHKTRTIIYSLVSLLFINFVGALIYLVSNPYVFFDMKSFLSSMNYETSVGLNTLPVFYTQGFYDTIPVLYQILHVYPFLLNPVMTILALVSFCFILMESLRKKCMNEIVLWICFSVLFISQAFFFIKWTRYMVPTLPFLFLLVSLAITHLFSSKLVQKKNWLVYLHYFIIPLILICNVIFGVSYFITAFVHQDTRIASAIYAKKIIPSNAAILSELYDLGITAYNASFNSITLYNTYDLDSQSADFNLTTWDQKLSTSDYIILPSQRVLQTRMINAKRYPVGHEVYTSLLSGKAGFHKIYETPCDIFCQITYLGDPVYLFEQTVNVFDRPTVMIFKKSW